MDLTVIKVSIVLLNEQLGLKIYANMYSSYFDHANFNFDLRSRLFLVQIYGRKFSLEILKVEKKAKVRYSINC